MRNQYPDTATEDEKDLGFQKLEIAQMGSLRQPEVVIARVLSPSDVLVKIFNLEGEIVYSHRRWGYSKTIGESDSKKWFPLFAPISKDKAEILIQEYDFHPQKEVFEGDTVGVPFKFTKLD